METNKEMFLNKIVRDLPIAEYRGQMTTDEWKGWFEDAYNEGYKQAKALQLLQTDVISSLTIEDVTKIVNAFTDINIPIEAVKEEIELNFL